MFNSISFVFHELFRKVCLWWFCKAQQLWNSIASVVVEYPPRDREVLGSNPPEPSNTKDFRNGTKCYSEIFHIQRVYIREIMWVHTLYCCAWLCCRFICTNIGPWPYWKGDRLLDHVSILDVGLKKTDFCMKELGFFSFPF